MTSKSSTRLLERHAELAVIEDQLARAACGAGSVAFVEGAAGIGKTSLGRVVAEVAEQRGFRVLLARGAVLERELPFGIVRQLFDGVLRRLEPDERSRALEGAAALAAPALGRLAPAAPSDRTPEAVASSRSSAFHGLYWLAANLAETAPVLLWVDDAHWADALSAQFLAFMSRRVGDLEMLLLVSTRAAEPVADEAIDAINAIRDESAATVLSPGPLGEESVAGVLRDVLEHDPEAAFVAACAQRTGGNPYLLHELCADLQACGIAPTASAVGDIDALGHATVGRSVVARLQRMAPGGRDLAEALAVLETSSELGLAAEVAGLELDRCADLADGLIAAEILDHGASLAFRHPLVRAAVYAQIPASRRAIIHGRAADALMAAAADTQHVAAQLLRSQPRGDPEVVDTLRRAASRAIAQAAPATACAYLDRALREPPEAQQRIKLLRELGTAEIAAGRAEGLEHLQEAIAGTPDRRERAAAALELGRALALQHMRFDDARKVLLDGIEAARDVDRDLWLLLEAQLSIALRAHLGGNDELASRLDEIAPALRGQTPGELAVLAAHNSGARIGLARSADEAVELAQSALAAELGPPGRPDPFEDDASAARATITSATVSVLPVLLQNDRLDTAALYVERILRIGRRQGVPFLMTFGLFMRANVAHARGLVADAEADVGLAIAAGRDLPRPLPPVVATLIFALTERGELAEADEQLQRHGYAGELPEIMPANVLLFHRGRLRVAQDRIDEAIADLETLGRRYARWSMRRPGTPWRAELALALHRAGRADEGVALAREELGSLREWGAVPRSIAIAERALGLVTPDPAEARERLRSSVDLLEHSPGRLDLAYSLVALGSALRRERQPRQAREILARGMDIAARCGSSTLAEKARDELLASGAKPRRHVLSGSEALTGSERRIAAMAARGLTNKQIAQELFLSTRTVETHLGHAYQKLDISSRTQLSAALGG